MMVVAMVMMARNSHHAFRAADNATGDSTDYATDRRANRTGCAPARGRASLTTPDDALSLCGERHRKKGKNAGGYSQSGLHGQTPCSSVSQSSPRSPNEWQNREDTHDEIHKGSAHVFFPLPDEAEREQIVSGKVPRPGKI